MLPLFSILALYATATFAVEPDELQKKPSGYAKDLLLFEAAKESTDTKEVYTGYFVAKNPKSGHLKLLASKTGSKNISTLLECLDGEPQKLLKKTPECAELGINYQKISDAAIDDKTLPYKISEKINGYNNKIIKLKLIQKASEKKQLTSDELLEIYFDTSKSFRRKFLDRDLSDEEIAKITGHQNFKRFLKWVTFDREAKNLSKSLAKIDCSRTEDPDALFLLGLLKIKTSNTQAGCFKKSALMSKKQADKDRGFFWEYLADGNTEHLQYVAQSRDLNFYSTIAKEKIGAQKNSSGIVFFDEDELLSCKNTPNYDDAPFVWLEYRSKLKTYQKSELTKLLSDYSCKQNGALYIAGLERKEGYKKDYFPILYKRAFVSIPPYRKALYYAIARQESFFVPGVVSSAYAVGVMQIIPELGGELAQKHGESLKIKELFEPDKNIRYASSHFKWLEDMVAHPTLIAVSYNAGYGFFKRIEREGLFGFKDTDKLRYEPYWSIENIPYDETREYAKKVTLNYAVYSEYFNPNAENSLLSIVENLVRSRRR